MTGAQPWRRLAHFAIGIALVVACGAPESDDLVREGEPDSRPVAAPDTSHRIALEDVTRANVSEFAHEESRADWSGGDPEAGEVLYNQSCWVCHGGAGTGHGPAATSINPKPRDFRSGRFYIDANANGVTGEPIDLARVILVGATPFGGSEIMQPWHTVYSTNDVQNLVAYVLSLSDAPTSGG